MDARSLAVVTGGASGIGAATARRFAQAGECVVIVDRRADAAKAFAREIGGIPIELDISDEQAVTKSVELIEREHGPIKVLINCAGPLQNMDPPDRLPMTMWDRITDCHLRGTYRMTVEVGSRMCARGAGSIVTVASVVGLASGPLHAYGPAKAALINLSRGLAVEWGRAGVRVNTVSPGFVRTRATTRGFDENLMNPVELAEFTALGRILEPDEIASVIQFLASELASGITGCDLPVDAGYLAASPWAVYGGRRPQGRPPLL